MAIIIIYFLLQQPKWHKQKVHKDEFLLQTRHNERIIITYSMMKRVLKFCRLLRILCLS